MKRLIFTLLSFAVATALKAQTAAPNTANVDPLVVPVNTHDFGKIPQGRPAMHVFEIRNTGKTPLKLDNVIATCGCTTPEWSKDDIAPGATARITVGYNAYSDGPFEKSITVQYNQNQTKVLVIKGNVYKTPPSPAPENASVKLLKQITQ